MIITQEYIRLDDYQSTDYKSHNESITSLVMENDKMETIHKSSLSTKRLVIFLSTILFFCFIQNITFALSKTDLNDIVILLNDIEQKAMNGQEEEAIKTLNLIINTDAEFFLKNRISTEKLLFLRLGALKIRGLIRLYNQGLYNEAIKDFTTGLTLDESIKPSQNPMALMYYNYRAVAFFQAGLYSKAITDITKCIESFDNHTNSPAKLPADRSLLYQDRALYYSANGNHKKALSDYKLAIELGKLSNNVFSGYAYELDYLNNNSDAAFFYKKVSYSDNSFFIDYLDKPIALKTKAFISNRIITAAKYIDVPKDLLKKAFVYSKRFSTKPVHNKRILVKRTQNILKTIGYDPGPIDGIAGGKTTSAIRNYQQDFMFPVDGKVTEELYNRLKITLTVTEKQKKSPLNIDLTVPQLVKQVMPAIVLVSIYDPKNELVAIGSGFFVEKSKIITNFHVVDGANYVEIKTYSGKSCHITNILTDKANDLALLTLDKNVNETWLNLSKNLPDVGQDIIAIGNPMGIEQTVSDGIVSAIRRLNNGNILVQISAPISHGSSGGPVLNLNGEVIGVSTSIVKDGQNLNFAVSSKHISPLLEKKQLKILQPLKKTQTIPYKTSIIITNNRNNALISFGLFVAIAVAIMGKSYLIPRGYIKFHGYCQFPAKCYICGSKAEDEYLITRSSVRLTGFWLLGTTYSVSSEAISVPICKKHLNQLKGLKILGFVLFPCIFIGSLWGNIVHSLILAVFTLVVMSYLSLKKNISIGRIERNQFCNYSEIFLAIKHKDYFEELSKYEGGEIVESLSLKLYTLITRLFIIFLLACTWMAIIPALNSLL